MSNLAKIVKLSQEATKFKALVERYRVSSDMTAQEIFAAFCSVEQASRPKFEEYYLNAATDAKEEYWARRASGLTTHGGRTRLNKLLNLAKDVTV